MLLLLACAGPDPTPHGDDGEHVDTAPEPYLVAVTVTLDGEPLEGASVMQGGGDEVLQTDASGHATVEIDPTVPGDQMVVAGHPEAKIVGVDVEAAGSVTIELERYDTRYNAEYESPDPGPEPRTEETTSEACSHCHVTIHEAWWDSPHRTSASDPVLQDLYAGTAALDEAGCADAGGTWGPGVEPGTGAAIDQCFLGAGVLSDTEGYGACADCHAPGINDALGGHDLLEATGVAYDRGIHCEICHHVQAVDLDAPPGTGGRLRLVRPTQHAKAPGMGVWQPITFAPLLDVVNPRMGAVYSPLHDTAELCAGCHQQEQAVLVSGGALDPARWPDGVLPVHSTYDEWAASPYNPGAPCQTCHMPPDPDVGNSADLHNEFEDIDIGVTGGWERPPGAVKRHAFYGPRQPDAGMLGLAASVDVDTVVVDGTLIVEATVANVGPGHAIPTGEPMRMLLLSVEASCDGEPLVATGGAVIPDFGGFRDEKVAGEDWTSWPGASVGDVVRVVRRTGESYDYTGFGPFGDGRFSAEEKGMPVEEIVGTATITAVDGDLVTFDRPLPDGDLAWRGDAEALAGSPGFAFARVMVGADGARMVPHFLATDIASDNRLLPGESWTSTHTFAAPCDTPEVHATLVHRNYPLWLAEQRGWALSDQLMDEVTR